MRALVLATLLPACGGDRFHDAEAARTALTSRVGAPNRTADVEVDIPIERANGLLAELIRMTPIVIPVDVPAIGPIEARQLTATVSDVVLQAGAPNVIRFAVRLHIDDASSEVTTIDAIAEVTPVFTKTELSIAVGPENIISLKPEVSATAGATIGRAVSRWLPKVPQAAIEIAARELGRHLTGVAWRALRQTLLTRLGSVTSLSVRLPDVPIARTVIRSDDKSLRVALTTDLPVRAGLTPARESRDAITVRIAGSAAAELANWAIDQKRVPEWYDRGLTPRADGEFRPRFDYVAGSHPFKIFVFQELGGASFFEIGADASLRMAGEQLEMTATGQRLEAASANPIVEAVAWAKFFLFGWIDESKRVAAHTQLTFGGRVIDTKVVGATYAHDELVFSLGLNCCVAST